MQANPSINKFLILGKITIMYILIKNKDHSFKSEIKKLIEDGAIETWEFVLEEEHSRLMHIGSSKQYNDVVLRFITTYIEGVGCLKVLPTVKKDAKDIDRAKEHLGIVLGRFAEMLNCHFTGIGSYETILD